MPDCEICGKPSAIGTVCLACKALKARGYCLDFDEVSGSRQFKAMDTAHFYEGYRACNRELLKAQMDSFAAPALSPGVTSEQEQTCQNCGKPVFFHGDTWYHVNGSDVMSCGPANVPREQWVRLPDEQTWYWHWNGEDLAVPHIYSVMTSHSGRSDRYFVAYPDSRWCDELGGWWLKIDRPNVPSREYQASLPARPELDKDEGGRCPECHSPDPTKMIDPFNNELIDNTGPYMQCQHPFHSASGREKGGLG